MFRKKGGRQELYFCSPRKEERSQAFATQNLDARQYFLLRKNIARASNGFDRDHAAGEASRTGYVKFHN